MESRTVLFDDELFQCNSNFNIDTQESGVDVYYLYNNSYIGEIVGITIPDEYDEDNKQAIEKFDDTVCDWLREQDINYSRG